MTIPDGMTAIRQLLYSGRTGQRDVYVDLNSVVLIETRRRRRAYQDVTFTFADGAVSTVRNVSGCAVTNMLIHWDRLKNGGDVMTAHPHRRRPRRPAPHGRDHRIRYMHRLNVTADDLPVPPARSWVYLGVRLHADDCPFMALRDLVTRLDMQRARQALEAGGVT